MPDKNDYFNPIEFRKIQENLQNGINAGIFHELAKYRRNIFDAYIKEGFTEEQAMRFILAEIKSS